MRVSGRFYRAALALFISTHQTCWMMEWIKVESVTRVLSCGLGSPFIYVVWVDRCTGPRRAESMDPCHDMCCFELYISRYFRRRRDGWGEMRRGVIFVVFSYQSNLRDKRVYLPGIFTSLGWPHRPEGSESTQPAARDFVHTINSTTCNIVGLGVRSR